MTREKGTQNIKMPLVSVVTPSFNSMPYIKETIESVRDQDYGRIQHIVFDGGSTDGTRDLLSEYPHLVWVSEKDRGQSDALNKGFGRAEGEIIGWLNADDTYNPGTVSFAVEYLAAHPDIDLIYSDVNIIDEKSAFLRLAEAEAYSIRKLLTCNMVKQPAVFMRRRVIERLGGVDESLHFTMDRELWLRAGLCFRLEYIPGRTLANFRYCRGTKTFESLPAFPLEWEGVLDKCSPERGFSEELMRDVHRAKKTTRMSYYFSMSLQSAGAGDRLKAMSYMPGAIRSDWRCLYLVSAWKLYFRILFGLQVH